MYKNVKLEEALAYSMLLDRMNLSIKNNWFDELGRAYVYCSIETIMEFANCGRNKAGEILKNLDAIGLIEKVLIPGRGLKIYVKNFIPKSAPKSKLLKLNSMHIEYVMDCWNKNKEKPRNVKKYLLAALFNAPSTM